MIYFGKSKTSSSTLTLAIPTNFLGQILIKWIQAINDKASTVIRIYKTLLTATVTTSSPSGATNLFCAVTAGIVASDTVIIQDVVDPQKYEVNTISSVSANVKYVTGSNLAYTYAVGAKIFLMIGTGGTTAPHFENPVGIATVSIENADAVFVEEAQDTPLLIKQDSCTSVCAMAVTGVYRAP